MTTAERLFELLKPFIGSEICPENSAKMKALILQEIPQLDPEEAEAAVSSILNRIDPKGAKY